MLLKASKENGYRPEENLNFETQARGQHDAKMFWGSLELLNRLSQATFLGTATILREVWKQMGPLIPILFFRAQFRLLSTFGICIFSVPNLNFYYEVFRERLIMFEKIRLEDRFDQITHVLVFGAIENSPTCHIRRHKLWNHYGCKCKR